MSSRNGTITIGGISQQLLAESASTQLLAINASTREQRGDDDKEFRLQADRNAGPKARRLDRQGINPRPKNRRDQTSESPPHRIKRELVAFKRQRRRFATSAAAQLPPTPLFPPERS